MDERRTNILVGDEVLRQIDDAKNVTHVNGVMTVELTDVPNPLTIGAHQIASNVAGNLVFIKESVVKTFAALEDLAGGDAVTWETLSGKPDVALVGHTHPEYEGGSSVAPAIVRGWGIRGTIFASKDTDLQWNQSAHITILLTGKIDRTFDGWVLLLWENDNFGDPIPFFSMTQDSGAGWWTLSSGSSSVNLNFPSTTDDLDLMVTLKDGSLDILLNGVFSSVSFPKEAAIYANGQGLSFLQGLQVWKSLTYWNDDPAQSPPLLNYQANLVQNEYLPNTPNNVDDGVKYITLSGSTLIYG